MDRETLNSIRHPTESSRFVVTVITLALIALIIFPLILGSFGLILIYILPIVLTIVVLHKIARAVYMNNMVRVTQRNFPAVDNIISEAKDTFGYRAEIEAYVYEKGEYNMLLQPPMGRKIILINSEILISDDLGEELRFLIGRFVGALASRHFRLMWAEVYLNAIEGLVIFNVLLNSYERAVIYSGDRLGLHFAGGKIGSASTVLVKTMVGRDAAKLIDKVGFLEQGATTRSRFSTWLSHVISKFPHTTWRMANLALYAQEAFPEESQSFLESMSIEEAIAFKNYATVLKKA